jgi:hypothetical protein
MDVLLFAIVLVALTAFVAAPLYGKVTTAPPSHDSAPDSRHEALIRALRDLEVDRASGLVPQDAYERERAALEQEASDTV